MARLTDEQLADRRNHLGASDIAVLAGVSPYATAFELYLEKIGELDPDARRTDADRGRLERGHRLEDVALDWYADIEGIQIERIRRDVVHPKLPFVVVHPDARVKPWTKTRTLLEAKTARRIPDGLPQHWEAQVQTQIAATNAAHAKVVVLTFDGPPSTIDVARDDELIGALEMLAIAFWDRVQTKTPPPIDGSRAASHWLDRMWTDEPEQPADANQAEAIARLLAIRSTIKSLEAEDDRLVNALKFTMAGGGRLYAPKVGKVLWTAPTTRRNVSWKEVAGVLRRVIERLSNEDDPLLQTLLSNEAGTTDLDDIESIYTTTVDNVRQFRVTPAKDEDLA